jgi:MFS family permease
MSDQASAVPAEVQEAKSVSVLEQVRTMGWNFWVANIMEAFERLAFFGVRAVLPLYMVGTTGGGIGLSYSQKGLIYGIWALVQCLVPMVSGGYTEAYGYKKSLFVAFALNILGYVLMANANGFGMMLAAACFVGLGTALFKPPVQGSVAKSLTEKNSGLGFGIFYWVVNIGGFIAPMAASWARGNDAAPTWHYVFYGAAIVTAVNFLPTIFLFREPARDPNAPKKEPVKVFAETMKVLWEDKAMLRFLLIVSGFWFMFMQLWDLLPNFLDEWVDTRDVGALLTSTLGTGAASFLNPDGAAKPEILINIDSAAIILLVLPLSWLFGRYKMMTSLVLGMSIGLVGFIASGLTAVGVWAGVAIFVFAIGEIICSPKFSEYIGMTAPPDRKALYMGYGNIPFAIGWFFGNILSGPLYETFSSKAVFARRFLVEQHGMTVEAAGALKDAALYDLVAARIGGGATIYDVNRVLWDSYHPWVVWPMLGAVGLISLVGMVLSYRKAQKSKAPAAQASA